MRRVPGAQVQRAVAHALIAAGICDGRVYDEVPGSPVFPYATIGDEQVIEDGDTCYDGWEVVSTVHLWSRSEAGSKVEVKTLMAAAVTALRAIESIDDFSLIASEMETDRTLRDPDGKTDHAVITHRFVIVPA